MKERLHYFSLCIKGDNEWHKNGEIVKIKEKSANIGETADCDIRFDANDYSPEYYATILKDEDENCWRIVSRSQYVQTTIEGSGSIGIAHQLRDGDIIRFDGQQVALQFNTHFDSYFYEKGKRTLLWSWIAVLLICAGGIFFFFHGSNQEDKIIQQEVADMEESILSIKVDSVQNILIGNNNEELLYPTKILSEEAPMGTAFLTSDGVLVTARHCVEYWIGHNLDLTTSVVDIPEDDIVRWAIETETFNQNHAGADSLMVLRVFFSIYDFMGEKQYSFASTDTCVHMNKANDAVYMLADFNNEYYWRSVRPYFEDRTMELGDILWITGIKEKGKLQLSQKKEDGKIKRGTPIMVCGYPMTGVGDKRVVFSDGKIVRECKSNAENIFFESNINHGFSGGPVLIKCDGSIVAIGVVSRVDSISSGLYKWAVPVTEIK